MSLLKVSVENMDSNDKMLHEIDMSKPLDDTVKNICKLFGRPYSKTVYGLKLISTNDGKTLHTYITEDNFSEIKDGYFLKLVFSLSHYAKRIFDHISDEYKEKSFQDLYELSVDPEFIKELVRTQKHSVVMDVFTNTELAEAEATACLIAIVHLFQKLYINEITETFLTKVISICKKGKHNELIKYALSVIHKILCHRDPNFAKWKEEAIKQMSIADLMNYIKKQHAPDLQYGALLVINALVKCCKGEKRQQLIKEINQKANRQTIYEHIISLGNVDKNVAHELYIYQTHLLSLYAETLTTAVSNDSEVLLREFELVDNEVKKMTLLMDFDESATKNKSISIDNLIGCDDVRISLASMSSKYSEESRFSNRIRSTVTNENMEYEDLKPSLLTIEALTHYRQFHFKNFYQTQVEEEVYEPGILASSETVVRMLAKILHVGMEPDRTCICYQPTIFTCSSRTPFFFELFSRTMWLLSKTRREMKASTLNDYEKVINVLAKQVKLTLEEKAMDFKKLTDKMVEITYETVVDIWQKEKQQELRNVLDHNPSVKVLRKHFSQQNEQLIFEQRMNYVRNGTLFPKFNDNKKINGNFKAKLSPNGKELLINDYNVALKTSGEVKAYPLEEVKHVVEEKACPHVKNGSVKEPFLAFSIIINPDIWINFKAPDRKTAKYWLDALNLLTGRDIRSTYYSNELRELTEMDLVLHLMELQNVTIPKKAPPIPPLPFQTRPPIPPKPQTYSNNFMAK